MTPFAWTPTKDEIEASNIWKLMQLQGAQSFAQIQQWSVENIERFWEYTIEKLGITFDTPYSSLLNLSKGITQPLWLDGARYNIAGSCFKGDRNRTAIITRRANGTLERITLDTLDTLSNRVANGLKTLGLQKGDAVAIDMAMTAESVAIYLGIVKAGCAAISIPDSFPAEEIEKRLRIGKAKLVFTQDMLPRGNKLLPMYEKVCAADAPQTVVLPVGGACAVKLRDGDVWWEDFVAPAQSGTHYAAACGEKDLNPGLRRDDGKSSDDMVICEPQDTITILFSSGTTGDPKAIPWNHTTPIKCASDAYYHHNITPTDIVCWPTSLGWMMGPWLIFATFLNGATLALYEGTPVERGFCEFVQDAKVTMLGLVPSIAKGWRTTGCAEGLDWSHLRCFSSSGEASNAEDYGWLMQLGQKAGVFKPVVEYCGGTEIGGGYLTNNLITPQNPAEFNGKTMGIDFVVLDETGKECRAADTGEVFLIPPSIGLSTHMLNADNEKVYYEGVAKFNGKQLRKHGDRIHVLGDNRFQSDGRADNTMNLGGIKVGSAEIERVVNKVPGVVETAAIGVPPKSGGADRLVIYTVAEKNTSAEALKPLMQQAIKTQLNPLYHVHEVVLIAALPRTASNKVMHKDLRKAYREQESHAA